MADQPHEPPPHLLEPYHYISSTPGKNIRSALIDCFQLWLCVPLSIEVGSNDTGSDDTNAEAKIDILSEIKQIIASLHNASLLIDDIEDNSKLRRGQPVAHSIFGVASVINCANYVYFLALERCRRLGSEKAMKVRFISFDVYCICKCTCLITDNLTLLPFYHNHVTIHHTQQNKQFRYSSPKC